MGNTPLVRLKRLPGVALEARGNVILAKLEGNNPAGSVKDRPALSMIRHAEQRGDIKPGDTLTSAMLMLVEGRADPSIKMPHGKEALPKDKIDVLKKWVEQGAKNN